MMRYVIIGNGAAANSAAEEIRKLDQASPIVMFSREPDSFYYTPALPEIVSGEKAPEKLMIHGPQWYVQQTIDLRLDCKVLDVDPTRRRVVTVQGEEVGYDRLLLATGGNAFMPPIPGADLPGVFTLRTMADARRMRNIADKGQDVVLIGGGLLGLEAGNGLRRGGAGVQVVEVFPRLLPRQTDIPGARMLQGLLEALGFGFRLGRTTREIVTTSHGLEILLDDGSRLGADAVVISAGVRPELELARKLGLTVDKAVQVDDRMRTSREGVYAAGDVCEHRGRYYGIWSAAMEQGRVAGANMAGVVKEYPGTVIANSLKVAGIALTAFGEIDAEGRLRALVHQDPANGVYRKLVHENERILGGIFLGDERGAHAALAAMHSGGVMDASIQALFPPSRE